jgi:glutamyl/glutaminyl-tRNA synthetase
VPRRWQSWQSSVASTWSKPSSPSRRRRRSISRRPSAPRSTTSRALAGASRWDPAAIEEAFQRTIAQHGMKLGALAQPVRVAVTGGTVSPGIYEVLDVLGRERTLARLDRAARALSGSDLDSPKSFD